MLTFYCRHYHCFIIEQFGIFSSDFEFSRPSLRHANISVFENKRLRRVKTENLEFQEGRAVVHEFMIKAMFCTNKVRTLYTCGVRIIILVQKCPCLSFRTDLICTFRCTS